MSFSHLHKIYIDNSPKRVRYRERQQKTIEREVIFYQPHFQIRTVFKFVLNVLNISWSYRCTY